MKKTKTSSPECVLIGTYDPPLDMYADMLKRYGKRSEAYRDLQFSFINYGEKKLDYMDILNYSYTDKFASDPPFKAGDIPALAAVYLANYLRRRGVSADYINLFQYEKEQLKEFLGMNPLCVAITTTFYVMNFEVIEIVNFIREHNKTVKIVIGGPLIANHDFSYKGDALLKTLEKIGADIYVVESQGEATLLHLMESLRGNRPIESVPNIIYKDENNALVRGFKMHENNDLDENYINWSLFNDYELGKTLQTRTARSCAFKCSFCSYPARAGALTLASVDTVKKELDSIREIGNVKNVVFIDDTFNVPLPRFKEMCRMIIREGYNFDWYSYFRCSNADEEAIELMAKSGCKGVFLGIESGSPSILKTMNKAANISQYNRGIGLLKKYGIITFGSFIIGFPGETKETIKETLDFINEAAPDYYRLAMWFCKNTAPILAEKDLYGIKGDGFKWKHNTMSSMEAIDHIEQLYLGITNSIWMPQRSFDFWHIPYLLGKGFTKEDFNKFMVQANKLLRMEIEDIDGEEKIMKQEVYMNELREVVNNVTLSAS